MHDRPFTAAEFLAIGIDTVLTERIHRRSPAAAIGIGLVMDFVGHPLLNVASDAELALRRAVEIARKKFG